LPVTNAPAYSSRSVSGEEIILNIVTSWVVFKKNCHEVSIAAVRLKYMRDSSRIHNASFSS
jgi:hypothetical protein